MPYKNIIDFVEKYGRYTFNLLDYDCKIEDVSSIIVDFLFERGYSFTDFCREYEVFINEKCIKIMENRIIESLLSVEASGESTWQQHFYSNFYSTWIANFLSHIRDEYNKRLEYLIVNYKVGISRTNQINIETEEGIHCNKCGNRHIFETKELEKYCPCCGVVNAIKKIDFKHFSVTVSDFDVYPTTLRISFNLVLEPNKGISLKLYDKRSHGKTIRVSSDSQIKFFVEEGRLFFEDYIENLIRKTVFNNIKSITEKVVKEHDLSEIL